MAMTGTAFSIRPVQPQDLDQWLALRNEVYPWPSDRDRFLFSEALRDPEEPLLRLGAWTVDGTLAATAECFLSEDGEKWTERAAAFVTVATAYRRQGLGGRLAAEVEQFARQAEVRWLEAIAVERELPVAMRLLTRMGFMELERYHTSVQQSASIDLAGLDDRRARLNERGIETLAFSEIDSAAARRELYGCAMEIEHDMPHEPHDGWRDPPYETWARNVFKQPGSSSRAIFVARDGDQIVGLTYLVVRADGDAEVGDTGVRRPYRGRGIARTLKMMATRFAAQHGIPRVHTDNRDDNAAMLAINRDLGFRPNQVIVIFETTLRS